MYEVTALWNKKEMACFTVDNDSCSSCGICFEVLWKKSNFYSESPLANVR